MRPPKATARIAPRAPGAPLHVLSIFGTRPEAIKMAPVLRALQDDPALRSSVCVTAQHRELLDGALRSFGVEPDFDLDLMQPGQDLSTLCGRTLIGVQDVVRKAEPDVVLVQGDTTSALAAGLAAAYAAVPVAHVEAGLRTHDPSAPFPEELNRRLIDQFAAFCFAPTHAARRNLRAEGIPDERIAVTGNTAIDALFAVSGRLRATSGAASGVQRLLVTCHRRENFGEPLREICAAVREIVRRHPRVHVRWVRHPNPQAGAVAAALLEGTARIELIPPLSYEELVREMLEARLILTDSGGIQEESAMLGRPVLVLRDTTERTEGVAAGVALLVGTDAKRVALEATRVLEDPEVYAHMSRRLALYGDGHASARIAHWLKHLAGLTGDAPPSFPETAAPLAAWTELEPFPGA